MTTKILKDAFWGRTPHLKPALLRQAFHFIPTEILTNKQPILFTKVHVNQTVFHLKNSPIHHQIQIDSKEQKAFFLLFSYFFFFFSPPPFFTHSEYAVQERSQSYWQVCKFNKWCLVVEPKTELSSLQYTTNPHERSTSNGRATTKRSTSKGTLESYVESHRVLTKQVCQMILNHFCW